MEEKDIIRFQKYLVIYVKSIRLLANRRVFQPFLPVDRVEGDTTYYVCGCAWTATDDGTWADDTWVFCQGGDNAHASLGRTAVAAVTA